MNKINLELVKKSVTILVALVTILVCVLPMDNLSLWNGEIPGHRNQYELMAESILNGRIDFAYGDEGELDKLTNPYDPVEREQAGVTYHWDHAYYKGHYYMYFGIVPVFLVFLPYRVLTGSPLTTYHATQIFTGFIIAGIFTLFWLLRKLFFKKLPFGLYLCLCVAFSVASVWYAVAEPALYCTAITAAIALEIWSIFFFVWAVYAEKRENRQIMLAGIGALLGALVFGCRPPIAFANIVVLPLLYVFIRQRRVAPKLIGKLALAATPYVVVAASLMVYNYVRFENPFEFGQAYQLTVADQTSYSLSIDAAMLLRIFKESLANFFAFGGTTADFPYLKTSSVFFNFPIFLLFLALFVPPMLERAKKAKLLPFFLGLAGAVLVITAFEVLMSPFLLERYRMDIYFLMGILTFLALGMWLEASSHRKVLSAVLYTFCVLTVISTFLLYVRTVGVYYPEKMAEYALIFGIK